LTTLLGETGLIAGGGALGGLTLGPPGIPLGAATTSALLGGGKSLARGEPLSEAAWVAALDAALSGATAGVGRLAKAGVQKVAEPVLRRDFAIDRILDVLPKRLRVNVPALGGRLSPREAIDRLTDLAGAEYAFAQKQLAAEFARAMRAARGAAKVPAQAFREWTAEVPGLARRAAAGLLRAGENPALSPLLQGAPSALATHELDPGLPAGVTPLTAGDDLSGMVPGPVRRVMDLFRRD